MPAAKTKAILVWLTCLYAIYHYSGTIKQEWHFIDNVDLIIHEAGHTIFMPFGEFIAVLGGSILQVLVPIIFCWYFHHTNQHFSKAVMLVWAAVNLFNVGLYASDAVNMDLPLLGGEATMHDWNYLLLNSGLISQTKLISDLIYFSGFVCVALAAYIAYIHMNDVETKQPIISKIV